MKRISALILAFGLAIPISSYAVGAIAVDDSAGETDPGYGFVTGEDSEAAAKAAAMKQCKSSGNDNCKIAVWFKTCGAYVSSKKYYGWGYGSSKEAAISMAMDKCSSCKLVIAECE